jgi:hypothetical protein
MVDGADDIKRIYHGQGFALKVPGQADVENFEPG